MYGNMDEEQIDGLNGCVSSVSHKQFFKLASILHNLPISLQDPAARVVGKADVPVVISGCRCG